MRLSLSRVGQDVQDINEYGRAEVSMSQPWTSDDVEVLIDMLEDPKRCWFAAETLRSLEWNTGLVSEEQKRRLVAMLEVAPNSEFIPEHTKLENKLSSVSELNRPYRVGASALCADGPKKMWVCLGYLFVDEGSAQAFWDHHQWCQTKEL